MQAVSCTTIEQDDSWTTYLTDNDRVFFDTIKDCGAEGVFHFCTKFDGFDMRTVRQFSPDKINTELFRLMNMTTGSGNYTYRRKDTNLYMSCSTLYPTSNLRGKDIRSQNRCSQITALVFDIDNHAPDADPDLPQRICDNLEEAMLFDLLPRGFIVNTGRGAAIWMFLKPCNPNNTRVKDVYDRLHQKIREMLKLEISSWGEEFADVTLDESVQGSVHLMRVPSTYNSKAGCCCHVTYVPDTDWLYNNLFALAEKLSVPLSVPKKPAYRWNITEAEQLEWARQRYRMRLVEWAITRSEQRGGSFQFTNKCAYRFDAYLRFCQRNMTRIGNRHIVMLAVLSTACDNNQAASIEQARLVNATFEKPLPEKELKRICRFLVHPFKDPTIVTSVKTERKTVNPGKLFSMSDLQSFACKADKTLSPADVLAATQTLYEGGYVTYPRTNSSYLATNEVVKADAAIKGLSQNGITGLINKPGNKNIYDDSKIEAHSAITPTGKWPENLSGAQKTVFECILNRFCAVFCEEDCTVDRTTIVIHCYDEDFTLKGDVQVTPGWRKFEKPSSGDKMLPKLNKGDAVNVSFQLVGKMTTPPKRYTVEALNNWMVAPMRGTEKEDEEYSDEEWKEILSDATICTEATRADTVDRCIKSQYISLKKGVYYGEPAGFQLRVAFLLQADNYIEAYLSYLE